jgi:hypothetical protein
VQPRNRAIVLRVHTPCCRVHTHLSPRLLHVNTKTIFLFQGCCAAQKQGNRAACSHTLLPCPHPPVPTTAACEHRDDLPLSGLLCSPETGQSCCVFTHPATVSTPTHICPTAAACEHTVESPLSGPLCSPETGRSCCVFTHPATVSMTHTHLPPRLLHVIRRSRRLISGT